MLRHACLVLGASALHVSAHDELLAVVVPAHRGDLDLAVHSITNWPLQARCSPLTEQNVDLVLYYAGSSEEDDEAVSAAADTIAKTAGRCFANTRTVFAELEKKVRPIRTSTRKLPLKAVRCRRRYHVVLFFCHPAHKADYNTPSFSIVVGECNNTAVYGT